MFMGLVIALLLLCAALAIIKYLLPEVGATPGLIKVAYIIVLIVFAIYVIRFIFYNMPLI